MKVFALAGLALLASCASTPATTPPTTEQAASNPARNVMPDCQPVYPEVPRAALAQGISGTLRAEAHIVNGVVVDVRILSGPEVFHESVASAMKKYKCDPRIRDTFAIQEFEFRID